MELARARFDQAQIWIAEILKAAPDNFEANYLAGLVSDTWGLNRPDAAAAAYYAHTAVIAGSPSLGKPTSNYGTGT